MARILCVVLPLMMMMVVVVVVDFTEANDLCTGRKPSNPGVADLQGFLQGTWYEVVTSQRDADLSKIRFSYNRGNGAGKIEIRIIYAFLNGTCFPQEFQCRLRRMTCRMIGVGDQVDINFYFNKGGHLVYMLDAVIPGGMTLSILGLQSRTPVNDRRPSDVFNRFNPALSRYCPNLDNIVRNGRTFTYTSDDVDRAFASCL